MPNKQKNICLIPARGGSKRIPNKNIIDFFGKPMISYTIEAAIKSRLFGNHIYVSSDSETILKVAKPYKQVQAVRRPKRISGDETPMAPVALHLLEEHVTDKFDNLCLLFPNSPLRSVSDIKGSYKKFIKTRATNLMSVVEYYWLYPFWALQEKKGHLHPFFGKKYFVNSQELPKNIYCPSGSLKWVKVKNFLKGREFYNKKLVKYEVPFERSVDIDTYEDLELGKKLFKAINSK